MGLRGRTGHEQGFIALFAVMSLAVLVGVVALILARSGGTLKRDRDAGGESQALRAAHSALSRQLMEEQLRQPRWWIAPMEGSTRTEDGAEVRWSRRPLESRWRAGVRPWTPDVQSRWVQLGATSEGVSQWTAWLEARQQGRGTIPGMRGDLIQDREVLRSCWREMRLEGRWGGAERAWTGDEGGALGRLNLLGADPDLLEALSGVSASRVHEIQTRAAQGLSSAAEGSNLLSFQDVQALGPHATLRPFSESLWTVEVHLPSLKDPIIQHWRSSLDGGPPGNPWFKLRRISVEQW